MKKHAAVAVALTLVFGSLCLPRIGRAQAVYGSIYGTVTDNTGAVVPNSTITVTDISKGTSVVVLSNGSGDYTVQHLIPDTYDVKITANGFKSFEQTGIVVAADTAPKVDASLQVGGQNQTVTVSANSVPMLKVDHADVSTVFNARQVEDLPLTGRNFTSLQLLLPGAQTLGWAHASDENPQGSQQIQIDGQAFGGVAYELDGTDNQDPILGIIVINPPLDAISESKITTQNFDAEFGKAVSSVVTAQTKSGSNSFHGSAFDYRKSNANLAHDPYQQVAPDPVTGKLIPPGLYNEFGGSVGGPIKKDKIFFFGDYQGVRQKLGSSLTMTVPSQLLLKTCTGAEVGASGIPGCDFSEYAKALGANGIIYQANGTPYPGNVIPTAQLSQPAINLFKLLLPYAPNKSGSFNGLESNYAGSGTGIFNNNQWDERVDYQITQNIHAFERFSRFTDILSGGTLFGPAGGGGFGTNGFGGTSSGADDSLASGADIAISPKLLTDFRLGYYRYNILTSKYDQSIPFATQLGIPNLNLGDRFTDGAPGFNITDVGSNGTPANAQSSGAQYGSGLNITRCNCPTTEREDQFQIVNNWTLIDGNHTFKFGADLRYARNLRVPSDTDRAGLLSFSTGPTSNPGAPAGTPQGGLGFATFVLGDVTSFGRYIQNPNIPGSLNAKEFQKRTFFYGEDSWRITPNLTVNYGLRWELYFPETVNGPGHGGLMNLNDGYLRVAGVGGVPSDMGWDIAWRALAPRLGVMYQPNPKMVIRAGYGRSFDLGVFGSIFGHTVTQNLPVLASQTLNATGGITSSAFALTQGPSAYAFPAIPSNGMLPAPGYTVSPKARPNPLRLPTIDAWNLSLQQSITPTLSLTIAYVGNKGTHTLSAGDGNNTNPNEAGIFLPAQDSVTGQTLHYDPSVKTGVSANGGTGNSTLLSRYYGGTLAACQNAGYEAQIQAFQAANPGAFPTTIQPGQCGWTNAIQYNGDNQDTHFNALQVSLAKQFTKGLSFNANYAWQRGFNYAMNYATWDKTAVKGRDDSIREQQIVAYGVYELPFGRHQMFAASVPGYLNEVIGGWQLSPVLNWSSGLPFTLSYSGCSSAIPGDAPCYPNGSAKTLKVSEGKYNPVTHNRLFFQGATTPLTSQPFEGFTAPGLDQIGTAGRNDIFGPNYFNTDLAVQKDFPIRESLFAQFRMDAYNVFNHINAGNPNSNASTVSIDQGAQYISSGPGLNGSSNPRQLQFSVRLDF